ncbi:hypothetical protein [Actinomadura sp. 7K507]|uniref:hypothetical protein n=1 Tax=Actinomadura sp. 7K507 TaxID=2530365 RepID=UPI0010483022|nr:hypothetical protein [Actinomadura sp. 7K507]TDC86716.1 hypothetical protein E1285_22400 [Actinomadura sp. 7K507]
MTLASNFRENKAVYAVAGAGDFAVEKIREVPEQVTKYQGRARETATKYQGEVRETVDRYRDQVRGTVDRYRGEVNRYQDRVDAKDLPGAAVAYATHFGTRAVGFIDELAERGKKVVHREAVDVAELTGPDAKPATRTRATQPRKPAQAKGTVESRSTGQAKSTGQARSTTKKNGA